MITKDRIHILLNLFRILPAWLIISCRSKNRKNLIIDELESWNKNANTK